MIVTVLTTHLTWQFPGLSPWKRSSYLVPQHPLLVEDCTSGLILPPHPPIQSANFFLKKGQTSLLRMENKQERFQRGKRLFFPVVISPYL